MDIKDYLILFYENNNSKDKYTAIEIMQYLQRYLRINEREEERTKLVGFYTRTRRQFHSEMLKYHNAKRYSCGGYAFHYTLKGEWRAWRK